MVKLHTMVNQCYLPSQFLGMLQQVKGPAMDEIIAKQSGTSNASDAKSQ